MPVTLTVRQVRDALYQVERSTSPEGGAATTALLGRWFHEGLSFLASNDGAESPLAALAEADADLEAWKQILVAHTYEKFVGPRLARHCAALQESAGQVHTYWRAMQAACHWLAELCWSLRSSSRTRTDVEAPWQSLIDMLETDAPICCQGNRMSSSRLVQ